MRNFSLVLKYRLHGDEQMQVRGAARIKIDGMGGLTFFDVQNGSDTRLELSHLQSFSLVPIHAQPTM